MVASALALSLIGLGAVQALPAGKPVEERQIWLPGGSGSFTPGDGTLPVCLANVPLQEQPPCFLTPITGGLNPSNKKRAPNSKRQFSIGDGTGTFTPGQGALPECLTNVPLNEQPPCILTPITGGLNPSNKKRAPNGKRQFSIGDGTGTFTPGQGALPECLTNVPLNEQPPCLLPPLTGGLLPPTIPKRDFILPPDANSNPKKVIAELELQLEQLQNKPWKSPEDLSDIEAIKAALKYLVGIVNISSPPGTGSTFTPGKRNFVLPPDASTNPKKVITELELQLEQLQNKPEKSPEDLSDIEAIKAALKYLVGIVNISSPPGTGSTFTPGKRNFVLPPDAASNPKKVIVELELDLEGLQNKPYKTQEDLDDIEAIKAALEYLVGIVNISTPPGTGSTFTPGKRNFVLPPDASTNPKKVIVELELDLEQLQNKPYKTQEDLDDIEAIKAALQYLVGIVNISSPPGTGSTFTPGKRDVVFNPDTVGTYASVCPDLAGAELALEALLHKDHKSVGERIVTQKLIAFLRGCGITIVKSPDGTTTTLQPSTKRDTTLNVAGLQNAYSALVSAAATVAPNQPSFDNWLALQQISGLLEIYGGSTTVAPSKRQAGGNTITLGSQTCQAGDLAGLEAALAALLTSYGQPAHAPIDIFLVEQVIVTALQVCGRSVDGWTSLVPGATIPGGAITPDPTTPGGSVNPSTKKRDLVAGPYVPGGAIIPDPTLPGAPLQPSTKKSRRDLIVGPYVPGGAIVPDPVLPGAPLEPSTKRMSRRQTAQVSDPTALLAALSSLETAYGGYGSKKVPVPVWLIELNIVTILQSIPGETVPGWPVLGQGSVVLTPST